MHKFLNYRDSFFVVIVRLIIRDIIGLKYFRNLKKMRRWSHFPQIMKCAYIFSKNELTYFFFQNTTRMKTNALDIDNKTLSNTSKIEFDNFYCVHAMK